MQKNCFVCKLNPKKYKCPKCKIFYCSLDCNKTHKNECEQIAKNAQSKTNPTSQTPNISYEDPEIIKTNFIEDEEMRIPESKLKLLKKNEDLVRMLKDQQIRNMLLKIDNSKERITQLQRAMQNQDFLRMADQILDIVTPEDY